MSALLRAVVVGGVLLLFSLLICCRTSGIFQQDEQHNCDRPNANRNQTLYMRTSQASDDELNHFTENVDIFAPIASRQLSEMPEFKPGFNEDDELLMNLGHVMQHNEESLNQKHNVSDVSLMALVATAQMRVFSEMYLHRYDNYNDMRLAAGPDVDQDRCISQLESLVARADLQAKDKYSSTDVNFYQLMDTWGRFPSGFFRGNSFVAGMYHECNRLKIELPDGERAPTRYCSLSLRHSNWPRIDRHDVLNIKAGICIPRACDSSVHKHKIELLMRLVEHQFRQLERGQMKFHGLYCLPDEDSPLRSMLNSPKTMATLAFLTGWLSLLVYCTYMHHSLEASSQSSDQAKSSELTKADDATSKRTGAEMFRNLSITYNTKLLFSTVKAPAASTKGDASSDQNEAEPEKIIDFSCIDGVKVIAMAYVIMGHVIMCITMYNARECSGKTSLAFYIANMTPAFGVNIFFTITGALTCYSLFKHNQTHNFMTNPAKWTAFILLRYMRTMPMYFLVVLYSKTLAKYTSSGPLWDYATSSLSPRRTCEQEPWADTLLFRANFKPPLTACIPGSWYLANDFQFFLVTPFFLVLLYKRPNLGQALLYACTVGGYLFNFWSIMTNNVVDTRPIATFAPHGFKTFVSVFSHNYTRPYYRIPAYLIGLLAGYKLYEFERAKKRYLEATSKAKRQVENGQVGVVDKSIEMAPQLQEPGWSEGFKKYASLASLFLATVVVVSPTFAFLLPFNRLGAQFSVAGFMSGFHVLFAIATALYLVPACTGHDNTHLSSFFAASFWKPLVRLSLCAMLVNVEVINYMVQSGSTLAYYSNGYHTSMKILSILATYSVSAIVFILFEAPSRAVVSSLLAKTIERASSRVKTKKDIKAS